VLAGRRTENKDFSLMSERNKKRCMVLLPSGSHYEQLFDEILELAIIETGLAPSRIHWNSLSPTPINVFVDEIDQADALFADISENTAEIWLAVGCAVSLGKPLCLISSRLDSSLPFGIQYLPLISYPADAFPSDYAQLQQNISAQLSAIMPQPGSEQPEPQPRTPFESSTAVTVPSDDLASYEVMALTIIDLRATDAGLSPRDLGLDMQARGFAHLISHAMTALKRRGFIERKPVQISRGNELHLSDNLFITRAGHDWLMRHGKKTTTHRSTTRTRELSLNKR
jgi:hypothetical protein